MMSVNQSAGLFSDGEISKHYKGERVKLRRQVWRYPAGLVGDVAGSLPVVGGHYIVIRFDVGEDLETGERLSVTAWFTRGEFLSHFDVIPF